MNEMYLIVSFFTFFGIKSNKREMRKRLEDIKSKNPNKCDTYNSNKLCLSHALHFTCLNISNLILGLITNLDEMKIKRKKRVKRKYFIYIVQLQRNNELNVNMKRQFLDLHQQNKKVYFKTDEQKYKIILNNYCILLLIYFIVNISYASSIHTRYV